MRNDSQVDRHRLLKCLDWAKLSRCVKMQFGAMAVPWFDSAAYVLSINGWRRDGIFEATVPCPSCLRTGVQSGTRLEACRATHAEAAAILYTMEEFRHWPQPLRGSTMYVMGRYPGPKGLPFIKETPGFYCTLCARLMQAVGVETVVVAVKSQTHHSGWVPARMTMDEAFASAYAVAEGREDHLGNRLSGGCLCQQ